MLTTLQKRYASDAYGFKVEYPALSKVLIIEDDFIFGTALLLEFEDAGYEATQLTDAKHITEQTMVEQDLILLDVSLQDSDAVDVLQILETKKYQGAVQIVSACPLEVMEGIRRLGQEGGLNMLPAIRKPISPKDIRLSAEQKACAFTSLPQAKPSSNVLTEGKQPTIDIDLGLALRENWIEVWYQPKYDVKTGAMVGAECLARLRHPEYGIMPPSAFLPKASDVDMRTLTELVLCRACEDWSEFEAVGRPIRLAINVPGPLLVELPLVRLLREHSPKSPNWPGLVLEMTEEEALRDIDAARKISTQLQIYKVCLSIDDFGIGYSGFARLREIPFKEIKLDRSLVDHCADDALRGALCRTIVELAHSFGATAVAEGVERQCDLDYLRSIDCDRAQGYFCAKPMKKEHLLDLIRNAAQTSRAASGNVR